MIIVLFSKSNNSNAYRYVLIPSLVGALLYIKSLCKTIRKSYEDADRYCSKYCAIFFFCENNVVVNFVIEDTIRFQLVEIKGGLISDSGLELSLNLI